MTDDTEMSPSEAQFWDTDSDEPMPPPSQKEYDRIYAEFHDDDLPTTQTYTANSIRASEAAIPHHQRASPRITPVTPMKTDSGGPLGMHARSAVVPQRAPPPQRALPAAGSSGNSNLTGTALKRTAPPPNHPARTDIPITPVKTDSGVPLGVHVHAKPTVVPQRAPAPQRAPSAAGSSMNSSLSGTGVKRPAAPSDYAPPTKIARIDSAPVTSRSVKAAKPLTSNNTAPPGALAGGAPFSLPRMFHGLHGRYLEPFFVSHSDDVQSLLDRRQIARGVQWELVRGILKGKWDWESVKAKVGNLRGTNAQVAPRVNEIMLGGPSHNVSQYETSLWEELDREAKATVEHSGRGLGLMGEFEGKADWYGGKVQCSLQLIHTGEHTEPRVKLETLQMTRSTHLARELGSLSVISLHDDQKGALVKRWAMRKFILCGRTYVALPPKAGKVYMIETDENHGRAGQTWCGDEHRISYDVYIQRNNPLDLNANQPFAKYSTRFSLYLSTSIPVIEFEAHCIHFIDDEYAEGWTKAQNPPTETIMTDGCGFINRAAVLKICAEMKYERPPVAFQGRIAGSKGMWIVHPDNDSPVPTIWIRDSQRKIHFAAPLRRAHRIFDLLSASGPSSSLTLSGQAITILAHNGVPASVFCSLQKQGLKDLITPLMCWGPGPYAPAYLWNAINTVSKVTRARLQTFAGGASRALGFEKRSFREDEHDEDPEEIDLPQHTNINILSGEPLTCAEAALQLLQAGFDPCYTPFLSVKIDNIIKNTMYGYLTRYKIPVKNSFEAYIIPDPTGLLKEGEVFYRSSVDLDTPLRQDVVVGRYPMREPSDMQKVTAVDIPALAQYIDVLVISIVVIWTAVPANFLTDNFERQVIKVEDLGQELAQMDVAAAQRALQQQVLAGLVDDNLIGRYSYFHDFAVYAHGLDNPKTRRIAHMTSTLLDASKTGLRLLKAVYAEDQQQYGGERPACFGGKRVERPPELGQFVLDSLLVAGEKVKDKLITEFEVLAPHVASKKKTDPDPDVLEERAKTQTKAGAAIAADLEVINEWMKPLYVNYCRKLGQLEAAARGPQGRKEKDQRRKGPARTGDNIMFPIMQAYRCPIDGELQRFDERELDKIKASCAFAKNPSFAVSMAFKDVCELKRKAELRRGASNRVIVIDGFRSMGREAKRLLERSGHGES